jgi:hypothetical protein
MDANQKPINIVQLLCNWPMSDNPRSGRASEAAFFTYRCGGKGTKGRTGVTSHTVYTSTTNQLVVVWTVALFASIAGTSKRTRFCESLQLPPATRLSWTTCVTST